MNKTISRTPLFWSIFAGISLLCALFAYNYFSTAFPILTIDLKMDRELALQKAAELATKYNWGPRDYKQAAAFDADREAKYYIELEAGGVEKLQEIIKEDYFSLYQWYVRHFKEFDAHETIIYFTPDGRPYSFVEKLDEKAPGAKLTTEQARATAIEHAHNNWQVNFDDYTLVEESQVVRPSGRIDHTFIYEKNDVKVGEAPYRLKLAVSGDKFTELSLELKVPEGFTRRYEHMRSANNTIATGAQVILVILYFLFGCIIGLWLLQKKRYVLWNKPIFWGSFLGLLQTANSINQWPLHWLSYDTAVSTNSFTINFVLELLLLFSLSSAMFTLIFAAAESLTRKAFGYHPQLWKLWSAQGAPTVQTLGRTIGGYLLPSFKLAYIVIFYFVTKYFLGWWSPAEALIDPNSLATYVPWFSSVSQALTAGFWEECMFRAVPLAGAALLGRHFGKEKLCISIAFIVQAIVFGAGHANYPAQPAYARVVELIVSSCMFGAVYLWYGLLPAILSHFTYDVVVMSLPIFISSAPGMWINQLMVILTTLIPLWIVVYYRAITGKWHEMAQNLYNAAWQAPTVEPKPMRPKPQLQIKSVAPRLKFAILAAGIAGLCLWGVFTTFEQDTVPLTISRTQALEIATAYMQQQNNSLAPTWSAHAYVAATPDMQHTFVWQTAGQTTYRQLSGSYLMPPAWVVRYAQFEGDLEERAEEYRLYISNTGTIVRVEHLLPEKRAGKQLNEDDARTIALRTITNSYNIEQNQLKEISAESKQHPNRKDWQFIFQNTSVELPQDGQARITVTLGGDTVIDAYRSVFMPETWERTKRQQNTVLSIIQIICSLLFSALLVLALYTGFAHHYGIAWGVSALFAALLISKTTVQTFNLWSTISAGFSTSQPFTNQAIMALATLLIKSFGLALLYSLFAGFMQRWHFSLHTQFSGLQRILFGSSLGMALVGFLALIKKVMPQRYPTWADYASLGAYSAPLNNGFTAWTSFIQATLLLLMILAFFDSISKGWHKNKKYTLLGFLLFGIMLSGITITKTETIIGWLAGGVAHGALLCLLFVFVLRFDRAIIPILSACVAIFAVIENGILMTHPTAFFGIVAAAVLIGGFAWWWSWLLSKE